MFIQIHGVQMKTRGFAVSAIIAVSAIWVAFATNAQTKLVEGKVEAGRSLALLACTGCHVVAPDQPFKPIGNGLPRPPDFKEISNQPNITAASLQHHLQTLPAVPGEFPHAEPGAVEPGNTGRRRVHHQSTRQTSSTYAINRGRRAKMCSVQHEANDTVIVQISNRRRKAEGK